MGAQVFKRLALPLRRRASMAFAVLRNSSFRVDVVVRRRLSAEALQTRGRFQPSRAFAAAPTGPVHALHEEIADLFKQRASGSPPLLSAAQMVQLLFEVGV